MHAQHTNSGVFHANFGLRDFYTGDMLAKKYFYSGVDYIDMIMNKYLFLYFQDDTAAMWVRCRVCFQVCDKVHIL